METKKKFFFPLIAICFGILLCISLTSIFFSISSSKKSADSTSSLSSMDYNIFFLSQNNCQNEEEAKVLGKDIMINNDAGYVWEENENFYIISSAYENENDSTLMKNKLEKDGKFAEIIKVSFPAIKIASTYSNKERDIITSALNSFHDAYSLLYDTSISLDNNLINETNASLNINSTISKFNATKDNFDTLFQKNDIEFINIIKKHLINAKTSLNNLFEKKYITSTQTYSSLIKYTYCNLLEINFDLIGHILTSNN